jgi:hypothetical protein
MEDDRQGYIHKQENTKLEGLQAHLSSGLNWAYVSSLAEAKLTTCCSDLPTDWPRGRAFGEDREVRWRRLDDGRYRVAVLTENPEQALLGESEQRTAPETYGVEQRTILLWGEMSRESEVSPPWIEVRIPQPLHYPLEGEDLERPNDPQKESALLRVVIEGWDYTDGGVRVATRWAKLKQPGDSTRKE